MDISAFQQQIAEACRTYGVKTLHVFGSVVTDRFQDDSDLDFVVALNTSDPLLYTEQYFGLKFFLEQLFQRKIDLLEEKALRNQHLRASIDSSKELLYAA